MNNLSLFNAVLLVIILIGFAFHLGSKTTTTRTATTTIQMNNNTIINTGELTLK